MWEQVILMQQDWASQGWVFGHRHVGRGRMKVEEELG